MAAVCVCLVLRHEWQPVWAQQKQARCAAQCWRCCWQPALARCRPPAPCLALPLRLRRPAAKTERLKQAKTEAEREIAAFKAEREAEFKRKVGRSCWLPRDLGPARCWRPRACRLFLAGCTRAGRWAAPVLDQPVVPLAASVAAAQLSAHPAGHVLNSPCKP